MTRVIVSLTTIPPRFAGLQDCLESLLQQTAQIDQINLYLPRRYRRFPGDYTLPKVPPGITIRIVEDDYGPATKVLPAAVENAGTDTLILFCDDDKVYHPTWAQHLVDGAKVHPDCCIVAVGANVSQFSRYTWSSPKVPAADFVHKDWWYRAKRATSLGRWKPSNIQGSGYVDILCGWAGCAVRPEFFCQGDFDIPDILWTVDDVWLSGCLERNGVPIWLENLDTKKRPRRGVNDTLDHALRGLTYKGYDRQRANQACIRYFKERYGIWGGREIAQA